MQKLMCLFVLSLVIAAIYCQTPFVIYDFEQNQMNPPAVGNATLSLIGGVSLQTASPWASGWTGTAQGGSGMNTTSYPAASVGEETAGIQIDISTVGHANIQISWNNLTSNAGANRIRLQYTIDGNSWINYQANEINDVNIQLRPNPPTPLPFDDGKYTHSANQWMQRTADLSHITEADNNPSFGVRFVTAFPSGGSAYSPTNSNNYATSGTQRFDNITFYSTDGNTIYINSIAELKQQTPGTGAVFYLPNEILVTYTQDFRGQKFIRDNSSAIMIDDYEGIITSSYQIGDGITGLQGNLNSYEGMFQFVPTADPGAPSSSGNLITPILISMDDFIHNFSIFQAQLVTIQNLRFVNPSGNFIIGETYELTNDVISIFFRCTFYDADYISTLIPTEYFDLAGILTQRIEGRFITARFLNDFLPPTSEKDIPKETNHALIGNYPNPFNPSTTIYFEITQNTMVSIHIYNSKGQKIKTLFSNYLTSGKHAIIWHGDDDYETKMPSGVYFYRMETDQNITVKKAILIK